jgi:Zn-dependent protease
MLSLPDIVVIALAAIIAITFHEAAHGFVAHLCGDDTAWRLGRVTFNPLKHIDPFGTIILPLLLYRFFGFPFGYAKPVPVNFGALNNPRRDMVWVALAGPGTNILLAILSALLIRGVVSLGGGDWDLLLGGLIASVQFNLLLALFNMIPLPPLDGGRVAVGLLPDSLAYPLARMEKFGIVLVLTVIVIIPFIAREFGREVNVLAWILSPPLQYLESLIFSLSGLEAPS